MQTDTLQSQTHSLIASDRVEGTPVARRREGRHHRAVDDRQAQRSVAYAVLSFGGFLGVGQKHAPIPWARLTYDRTLGATTSISPTRIEPCAVCCKPAGIRLGRPQPRGRDSQLLPGAALLGRVLTRQVLPRQDARWNLCDRSDAVRSCVRAAFCAPGIANSGVVLPIAPEKYIVITHGHHPLSMVVMGSSFGIFRSGWTIGLS
jgi:hypothetical protein